MNIKVHYQSVKFRLKDSSRIKEWLNNVVLSEDRIIFSVDYFFLNNQSIQEINLEFLEHDFVTDVITFDYSDEKIGGEIYIGIETVKENSLKYKTSFKEEVHRVMVHGILHLLTYDDKDPDSAALMRNKEDYYLEKLNSEF